MKSTPSLADSLRSFHEDEDGMETLQTVMIAGIAAIILITLIAFWGDIKKWARDRLKPVKDSKEDTGGIDG